MADVLKPPAALDLGGRPGVFLAGSIEMGLAEPWQARLEQALGDLDIILLNPRRDDWDATWQQSITDERFRAQVEWELSGLETAALVLMYFAPDTKAPVTLLELGLAARRGRLIVCCPDGFWRKGNVEVVCARYAIPLVDNLDALIAEARRWLAPAPGRTTEGE